MTQSIDDIITKLSEQKTPSKRLWSPLKRSVLFMLGVLSLLLCLGGLVLATTSLSLRADIEERMVDAVFLIEISIMMLIIFTSTYASFILSVPEGRYSLFARRIPCIGLLVMVLVMVLTHDIEWHDMPEKILKECNHQGVICTIEIVIIALIPTAILTYMAKRSASVMHGHLGFSMLLMASSMGYILQRLVEENNNIYHLLLWHIIPVIILSLIGIKIGKIIFRW